MKRFTSWMWGVGISAAIAYLAGHTLTGRDGLVSFMKLQERERALTAELAELKARRTALSGDVARLSPRTLSRDDLEGRARRMLAAVRPDERILLLPAM